VSNISLSALGGNIPPSGAGLRYQKPLPARGLIHYSRHVAFRQYDDRPSSSAFSLMTGNLRGDEVHIDTRFLISIKLCNL
jgi:hypothetical protein